MRNFLCKFALMKRKTMY